MSNDVNYHTQRKRLLASALDWVMQARPPEVSLQELSEHLQLGTWEVQHLFQEYLGCDPQRLVRTIWSPSLAFPELPPQLSFFDEPASGQQGSFLHAEITIAQVTDTEPDICFSRWQSCLGEVFVANTELGICQLTFEDAEDGEKRLRKTFPKALLTPTETDRQEKAVDALRANGDQRQELFLHVKATPFQRQVWQYLTTVLAGKRVTYQTIAQALGDPNAARAVGAAVGANPVALLIPCHRVVHQTGKVGHFRWGSARKQLLLAIEKQ